VKDSQIEEYGVELYRALRTATAVDPLTDRTPSITIDEAYRIQSVLNRLRVERDGERVVGKKIGVTSRAVQEMLGVTRPDFGVLTTAMACPAGEAVPLEQMVQPRVEGEIAFVLARDLVGPGVTTADVLRATEYVLPCIEVVDSRIRDWRIRIQDTVADNASSGSFVPGDQAVSPLGLDFSLCGMVLERNGEVAATGAGAATLGSPVRAVAWLANTLGALGMPMRAGEVVLSGSLAALVPIGPGDHVRVRIDRIGEVSARFTGIERKARSGAQGAAR
jgi:2-oxopent-4-enoate/cis-2-oxohex-4-enoate hydratase